MGEWSFYDAIVIGTGRNGLSAAIVLARARRSVLVVKAEETLGQYTLLGADVVGIRA